MCNPRIPRNGLDKGLMEAIRIKAQKEADILVDKMIDDDTPDMARDALKYAISVVRANHTYNEGGQPIPAESTKDRLTACRMVLEWTKEKPAAKAEHTIKRAEDFLDELATKVQPQIEGKPFDTAD